MTKDQFIARMRAEIDIFHRCMRHPSQKLEFDECIGRINKLTGQYLSAEMQPPAPPTLGVNVVERVETKDEMR